MHLRPTVALAACLLSTLGCHSAYIETTITNRTPTPIQLLEVDYPTASFGTQNLAPGATFHYRFKVLGSGPTKLLYTDAVHQDRTSTGPSFNEGDEGRLTIEITSPNPIWNFQSAKKEAKP